VSPNNDYDLMFKICLSGNTVDYGYAPLRMFASDLLWLALCQPISPLLDNVFSSTITVSPLGHANTRLIVEGVHRQFFQHFTIPIDLPSAEMSTYYHLLVLYLPTETDNDSSLTLILP
jgi:hypothetical protein